MLRVKLKASETDPFRMGVFLFIGKNDSELYPIVAMRKSLLVG